MRASKPKSRIQKRAGPRRRGDSPALPASNRPSRARNANALRESDLKFRALASLAPVGIFLSDPDGEALFVNECWCRIAGLSPEQARGHGWTSAIHPDDKERIIGGWNHAVHDRAPSHAEFRFLRPDNSVAWVYGSATQLRDANGKFVGYIGTVADITERKKNEFALRENRERLHLAMDAAQIFSWEMDLETRSIEWTVPHGGMQRAIGFAPPEYFDSFAECIHPEDRDAVVAAILSAPDEAADSGWQTRAPHLEFRLVHPNTGELIWLRAQHVWTRNAEGAARFVALAQNITEQKRHEQELRRSEQLRRAISKSVQYELQRARDEALAASRAKDDFLAALSHELRTPLNPVLLLASEAAEDESLPPEIRAQFTTIRDNVELEARLIDDLLDLTRITRGKLTLENQIVEVHSVLRDAIATVQMELNDKQIQLSLDLAAKSFHVRGDSVRLRQVFWNVLKNAVRFTPQRGSIEIQTRADAKRFVVTMRDNGIGMTPAELEQVFRAFAQGEHANHGERTGHHFGGLGLGLAISRKLVEMHHGEIQAESPGRGHGSTFTISLPLTERASSAESRPESALSQSASGNTLPQGIRVLLVEDHEPTRRALAQLLTRRNYLVQTAGSLAEARALAEKNEFQILISDIGLPDGDGYALMMELGRNRQLKGIALTGYGMEHDVAFSQSAGFVAHLTKPVRVQSLETALAAATSAG